MKRKELDRRGSALALVLAVSPACAGGSSEPVPAGGFDLLGGQTVLVLPVQYVRQVPGGWLGGSSNESAAARQADRELGFALGERGGRAKWILPEEQVGMLRRRPSIEVDPYALSTGEARRKGANLKDVEDPLRSEIRMLSALFDCRYAVLPLEILYVVNEETGKGRLGVRTFLVDTRRGEVLWYGVVPGRDNPEPASAGALAALAQVWADFITP